MHHQLAGTEKSCVRVTSLLPRECSPASASQRFSAASAQRGVTQRRRLPRSVSLAMAPGKGQALAFGRAYLKVLEGAGGPASRRSQMLTVDGDGRRRPLYTMYTLQRTSQHRAAAAVRCGAKSIEGKCLHVSAACAQRDQFERLFWAPPVVVL